MRVSADRVPKTLIDCTQKLAQSVEALTFASSTPYVYNPLIYARKPHELYVSKYGRGQKKVLLLGMNPGPWGMAQTGVPFGEVNFVRDWLQVEAPVARPNREHPKRPIQGFACPRSEVSGRRLWGWIKDTWKTPQRFFASFYVANYCPLLFVEESGRNRTPDKLPVSEREPLFQVCDMALQETVKLLKPQRVIGIGAFAAKRADSALSSVDVRVDTILHPSPASPTANKGWAQRAWAQLTKLGVELPVG